MPASLPSRTTGRWWIGYWKKQSRTSLTGRSVSMATTASVMIRDTGSSGRMSQHFLQSEGYRGTPWPTVNESGLAIRRAFDNNENRSRLDAYPQGACRDVRRHFPARPESGPRPAVQRTADGVRPDRRRAFPGLGRSLVRLPARRLRVRGPVPAGLVRARRNRAPACRRSAAMWPWPTASRRPARPPRVSAAGGSMPSRQRPCTRSPACRPTASATPGARYPASAPGRGRAGHARAR